MYTIDTDTNDSWTSLSELLQGDNPSWTEKNSSYYEIEMMIEQNQLLKQIKEKVIQSNKKDVDVTCDTSLFNGLSGTKYLNTSTFSKNSETFQKRINRSFQILNQKPVYRQQLRLSQYQILKQKIQHHLTAYELSIFSNLIYELKTTRSCRKQLENREYQLIKKLSQSNDKILQLQLQTQKQQKLISDLQSNIKTKQLQLVAKQKNLSRFQVSNFLKQKMLFEKQKILNTRMKYLQQTEKKLKNERILIDQIYENVLQNPEDNIYSLFIELLKEQKHALIEQQCKYQLQYQNISKLIAQIQHIKIVEQTV